jgi:L-2,4-diaminobutyric acid acetyltransferase
MSKEKPRLSFKIRNVKIEDIQEVYKILTANKPFVGLNSRYTYFLLARDFSNTCVVAEHNDEIVGFSSGYVPPNRKDTFFNWETVVKKGYRGYSLQKRMLLHQIKIANSKYFEGTVNPSNDASKRNFATLCSILNAKCETKILFSEEDFGNDGHETEILYRIGPISSKYLDIALKLQV